MRACIADAVGGEEEVQSAGFVGVVAGLGPEFEEVECGKGGKEEGKAPQGTGGGEEDGEGADNADGLGDAEAEGASGDAGEGFGLAWEVRVVWFWL